ncbi:MAG: hypothetical protein ACI4WX_16480 [Aristaeellaceae bacterium]
MAEQGDAAERCYLPMTALCGFFCAGTEKHSLQKAGLLSCLAVP